MPRKNAKMSPAPAPPTPSATATPIACGGCGCTEDRACPGGCEWIVPGLCSECAAAEHPIVLTSILFGHEAAMWQFRGEVQQLRAACTQDRSLSWPAVVEAYSTVLHELFRRAGKLAIAGEEGLVVA